MMQKYYNVGNTKGCRMSEQAVEIAKKRREDKYFREKKSFQKEAALSQHLQRHSDGNTEKQGKSFKKQIASCKFSCLLQLPSLLLGCLS